MILNIACTSKTYEHDIKFNIWVQTNTYYFGPLQRHIKKSVKQLKRYEYVNM